MPYWVSLTWPALEKVSMKLDCVAGDRTSVALYSRSSATLSA